jgi:hypothetical protein
MNYARLRIQRLTRELSEELSTEYGPQQAALMLEQAATEIRRTADAGSTRPTDRASTLLRGMTRRV